MIDGAAWAADESVLGEYDLRLLGADHREAVRDFEVANRSYFARFISDRGDAFFAEFDQRFDALLADQRDGHAAYHVLLDQRGRVVGRFNLIFDGDSAVLGYRVAEHATGRGVATAAVRLLAARVDQAYGRRTIRAAVSEQNPASARVLLKSGFRLVGPVDPAEVGGKPGSAYVFESA